jgi:methionyl-tRNA synthetase
MPQEPHKPFYVTTPIYYVNDRPHIGHVYTTVIADVVARYHRLMGQDVFFLTGTDEHAAKVVDAAAERGLTPQQWADRNAQAFQETFAKLDISNNDFIRTTEPRHKQKVQTYVQALMDGGDVYLGDYEGWYDAGQEEYVTETKARECDYKSPVNGRPLVRKTERNYFFRLSAFREPLLALLERGEVVDGCRFDVQPQARRNEIIARIREMQDVPISRTGQGDWGIRIPGDESHTIYVWIDALFNYLSTVDTDDRRPYWQAQAVHLIGKEILWFHAAIWPAMLLALRRRPGYQWVILPRLVYSHSYWIAEGQKMSKSLGNFVTLEKIDHYVATFGLDVLRFFLATQGPLGTTDSDFADSKFIEVYNTQLANTLGNCFSRVLNMTHRYFGGRVPEPAAHVGASATYAGSAEQAVARCREAMEQLRLHDAADAALSLVRDVDNYIEQTQPFKLAKDPAKLPEVATILYNCAEALRIASVLLWPVMPRKIEQLWQRLGCEGYGDALRQGRGDLQAWTPWGQLQPGTQLQQGDPLFPRHQPAKA